MKFSGYLVGGPLIAVACYIGYSVDKDLAIERSLIEPVMVEAIFVRASCVENVEFNRIMKSVLYTTYKYRVISNGIPSVYEAKGFETTDTLKACELLLDKTTREKKNRTLWYEQARPSHTNFDVDLARTRADGLSWVLWGGIIVGAITFLFGLYDQKKKYMPKQKRN